MNVRDLMEREVVTLHVTDTLDLADDIMHLARIRHLPVLANGAVVGIVSQRDLFRAGVSCLLQLGHRAEHEWLSRVAVASVMTEGVVTVAPDTSIRKAVGLMAERKIGCLPVVENGELVGLLSETDCLRYLAHLLDIAQAKGSLSELGSGS